MNQSLNHSKDNPTKHIIYGINSLCFFVFFDIRQGLITSSHRVAMVRLSIEDYNFVKISTWETEQVDFTQTMFRISNHRTEQTKISLGYWFIELN